MLPTSARVLLVTSAYHMARAKKEFEQAGERGRLPRAVVPTDLYGQCADYGRANRWLSVILITPERFGADREAVRLALEAENIESRPVWKSMHLQPVFQTTHPCRVVGGSVSQDLFNRGLCLPSGTAMTEEDQNRVVDAILGCRK